MKHAHPLDAADELLDMPIGRLIARFGSMSQALKHLQELLTLALEIEDARERYHRLVGQAGPRLRLVK